MYRQIFGKNYPLIRRRLCERKGQILAAPHWRSLWHVLAETHRMAPDDRWSECQHLNPAVQTKILDPEFSSLIHRFVMQLVPWRAGPITLFDCAIDAEWRSNLKWDRLVSALPSIQSKAVLDVGCSSGYFLLRLAELMPDFVVGIDPTERCYLQSRLIRRLFRLRNTIILPFRLEQLAECQGTFDVILCMGVLSHLPDPIDALRTMKRLLKPNGTLILETLAYPGEEPVALSPPDRYAKMRNIWFVPTESCLRAWLIRAGFEAPRVLYNAELTIEEQRRTAFAPYESLVDFLLPGLTGTIEGFPMPRSLMIRAEAGGR